MTDSTSSGAQWNTSPSAKARNVVQKAVTALLDELAPERILTRADRAKAAIQQHRTPSGCVLQADECAVSVSWFADGTTSSSLGELHVLVWRGKLSRRGSPANANKAALVEEIVLRPNETPTPECQWIAADGTQHDTASLAAKVLSLLDSQIGTEHSAKA